MFLCQFYHPLLSLFGTLLCVAAMFLMDWVTALLTYLITGVLYFYIYYRKPGKIPPPSIPVLLYIRIQRFTLMPIPVIRRLSHLKFFLSVS